LGEDDICPPEDVFDDMDEDVCFRPLPIFFSSSQEYTILGGKGIVFDLLHVEFFNSVFLRVHPPRPRLLLSFAGFDDDFDDSDLK